MGKKKILITINQLFKGGAETALINLLHVLPASEYEIDLLIFDQIQLRGSISLIPKIPKWVHVINIAEAEGKVAFVKKAAFKLYRKITGEQRFRQAARQYLRDRFYDVAISYGEWFSSALVAFDTSARRKYVWIHADIDKAAFLHPDILRYQDFFDGFIFASRHSMEAALAKFPKLKRCSFVIHNQVDRDRLRQLSKQPPPVELPMDGLPLLLTVANVRDEKNHLRQVEVMKLLFDRGYRFHWVNVGSLAKTDLVSRVKQSAADAGLCAYFHLPGAVSNPYSLMCRADAVCVLSDHESWSMVITEAKQLGVPVIATKTSGALEQIVDEKTGLLCGFSAEEIAARIEAFLNSNALRANIRENLRAEALCPDTLDTLGPILSEGKKKVLYVFDNINYLSGARSAALTQAKMVSRLGQVDLFSLEACQDETLTQQYHILSTSDDPTLRLLSHPLRETIKDSTIPRRAKLLRCLYAVLARLGQESLIPDLLLKRGMCAAFEGYDAIFVVSEASKLRRFVSERKHPVKAQWIHTDYAAWRERSAWTKAVTKHDATLYSQFDTIVCLNRTLREKFVAIYPQFAEKTIAVPNPILRDEILRKAAEPPTVKVDDTKFNLITIGRFEQEKRYDRLLMIAAELKKQGLAFHWYFVGDGVLYQDIAALRVQMGLQEYVTLTGMMPNPCPLLKQCDLMVLFSEYEGTPVTIDEAAVLGVPVLANDVGGVREQVERLSCGRTILDAVDIYELAQQVYEVIVKISSGL